MMRILIVLSCLLVSLGCESPFSPSAPLTPPEEAFLKASNCLAKGLSLPPVTLALWEKPKPSGEGYVACEAWPHSSEISCWREFLNGARYADVDKLPYAAHEVCHLSGIWDELQTEVCAHALLQRTSCPPC